MPVLEKLSANALEKLRDKRAAAVSENLSRLIAAGYGNTTGNKIRAAAQDNELFAEYVRLNDLVNACYNEERMRMRWHGSLKPIKKSKKKT